MCTDQSDERIFPIKVPSSKMALPYVKLTKTLPAQTLYQENKMKHK